MKTKLILILVISFVVVLVLSGCKAKLPSIGSQTPTPTARPTVMPTQTPYVIEKVVEKVVTAVPQATSTATSTPIVIQSKAEPTSKVTIATLTPTASVTATATLTNTKPVTVTAGVWNISYFKGATDEMKKWDFSKYVPDPLGWSVFPNVTNTITSSVGVVTVYSPAQGLKYEQETDFSCQGVGCFFVASAEHYRMWTGDGAIPELGYMCSQSVDGVGCAVMVINVGKVTAEWEANLRRGFTIRGRYNDGDALPQAIWAGLSNRAYEMLDLKNDPTNAGSNCGRPEGCEGVKLTFIITSGGEILMKGETIVYR